MRYITPLNRVSEQNSFYRFLRCDALIMTFGHWARLRGRAPSLGSVADRCIPHAAGTLYHTWNGSVPKLSDDLLNQLYAVQNTPSVEEALETKHWSNAAFYPPVILFDHVVQVGTISNLDGIVPTVIEFVIHPPCAAKRHGWARSHLG